LQAARQSAAALEQLVRQYEQAFGIGGADAVTYYLTRGLLNKKRIDILKLRSELVDAWIDLENASGACLMGAADQPSAAAPAAQAAEGGAP
jgi:hypothetical protein